MSDKAFCQIGKYMSDFLVNFLQRFLQLPQLSGTDSRFHLSVLHRLLHLLWLLGTDSRFLVFVLHSFLLLTGCQAQTADFTCLYYMV